MKETSSCYLSLPRCALPTVVLVLALATSGVNAAGTIAPSLDPCAPPLSDSAYAALQALNTSRGYSPMLQAYLRGNTTLTPDALCLLLAQDEAWRRLPPPPPADSGTIIRDGRARVKVVAPWLAEGDEAAGLTPVVLNFDTQLASAAPTGALFHLWRPDGRSGFRSLVLKHELAPPRPDVKAMPIPSWGSLVALGDATGDATKDFGSPPGTKNSAPPTPAGIVVPPLSITLSEPHDELFYRFHSEFVIAGLNDPAPDEQVLEVTVDLGRNLGGARFTVLRAGAPVANQVIEIRTPEGEKYPTNVASGSRVWVFKPGTIVVNRPGGPMQTVDIEVGAIASVRF